jgi:hypothetical protein
MLVGACAGAAVGLLLGRATLCSGGVCRSRANWVAMTIAAAFLGSAMAWHLATRLP